MIKQAIIPLAGLGTRLLPLTSVFAKELLPINGRPGIEYIIDECIDAGIKEIIMSKANKKDIDDIDPSYITNLKFHFVDQMSQVLDFALTKQKVKNPKIWDVISLKEK